MRYIQETYTIKQFLDHISKPQAGIAESFNVTIKVNGGSENVLQSWEYSECELDNFKIYFDENMLTYKMHKQWQSKFRDKSIFRCAGLSITT